MASGMDMPHLRLPWNSGDGTVQSREGRSVSIKYHDQNVGVTLGGGGTITPVYYKTGTSNVVNPVIAGLEITGLKTYGTDFLVPCDSAGNAIKPDLSQPFEIGCKFKIASSPGGTTRNVWGSSNSYYQCPTIGVRSGEIICYVTTSSSSWTNSVTLTPSGYSFPLDTYIEAKMVWDGTDFSVSVNDGTNTFTTTISNVTPYYNSGYSFEMGGQNKSQYSISAVNATIDLSKTYIKQNNILIWGSDAA